MGKLLQLIGMSLGVLGGLALAGIFLWVFVSGGWPEILRPVQDRFRWLADNAGNWNFPILVAIFVGPGAAIYWLGNSITEKQRVAEYRRKATSEADRR